MTDSNTHLMTILAEALEKTEPTERIAYLDNACGGNAELRRRVEDLIAAHNGMGQFLEPDSTQAHDPKPDDHATTFTSDGAPFPLPIRARISLGEVVSGRYTLVEVIGEGGMGSVYLANQTEPVKRQVALKLIKGGMDSRSVLARFDAERQALALMDHPNIARVYDGGTTERGQPFFVMELVRGLSLTEYCDQKRLTVQARLELFVQVCNAVQHAHQKGIIHRDLKPGNVLVTEVDGRPTPKVIDFGVAKATEQRLTDLSFAETGAIVGTPTYMSPEQADPSCVDIDTRTDVYALGVMLYELLTGSPPIDARQFQRGAILEMLRMVREVDPPKPSTKLSTADALANIAANRSIEPLKLAKALRGELDWVVMKALEKDRTRRYDTANGLARDIQRYLADEVVEARPPSVGYRLRKFARKHKGQVIAASLVLFVLVGGIVGTTLGLIEARKQEGKARVETVEKETARLAEAERVVERDKALKAEAERSDELHHRLGVSAMVLASAAYDSRDTEQAAQRLEQVPVGQRDWEWRYLKQLTRGGAFTLPGLGQGFWGAENTAVAFSPDGERIVTGISDANNLGSLRVWDARTGLMLSEFKGIKHRVTSVIFSADSTRIVTLEYPPEPPQSAVKVWDAKTGKILLELKTPLDAVNAIALSPDGGRLVSGGDRIKVWDLRTGEAVLELDLGKRDPDPDPFRQLISGVAFSPDGKRIATCRLQGELKLWDAQKGGAAAFTANLPALPMDRSLYAVSFSPDGTRLLAGYSHGTAKVLNVATGAVQWELKGRQRQTLEGFLRMQFTSPQIATFSPDGSRIVMAGGDAGAPEATVWDARTGTEFLALTGHTDSVLSAAFSPDGTRIVTGSADGTAKVWNASIGTPRFQLGEEKTMASAFSLVEDHIVVGGKKTTIYDMRTGAVVREMDGLAGGARCAAYSRDGTRVVIAGGTGGFPGRATVWDARTGAALFHLEGLASPVNDVAFSPDGAWIVTAAVRTRGSEMDFKIWDASNGKLLHDLSKAERESFMDERGGTIAFSPDGSRFVVGGLTGPFETTVLDSKTLKPLFELKDGRNIVMSVAFSNDGTRILTGGNKTVKMWDARTGKLLPVELHGHAGTVLGCGFNPDGTRIVTGGSDRTVRIWDARTGTALLELKGHSGFVQRAAFNRDGTRIATVSEQQEKNSELIVWEAPVTDVFPILRGHDSPVRTATYSPDGTRIVAITQEGLARVWNHQTASVLYEMTVTNGGVGSAAVTADGSRIVTQEWVMNGQMPEQRTRVRDARTGNVLPDEKIPETVPGRTISPDRRHYAHVVGTRIEFLTLKPDEEELVRRRRQAMPDVSLLRRAFDAALTAKDDFAARVLLKSLPENERPLREAQLAVARGLMEEAITLYRKAVELHPRDGDLQVALGHVLREAGRKPEALACFEKAIELDEGHAELGQSLLREDPELAIACFRKAVQVHPGRDDLQERLSMLLKSSGRLEEAIAALRVKIGQEPKNATLHSELGDILWDQGKRDEAFASYRTAAELDPGRERSLRLAVLQSWFGRDKELAETRQLVLKLEKEAPTPFGSLLVCFLSPATTPKDAEEPLAIVRAKIKASKNPYLWIRLAVGLGEFRTGDYAASIDMLRDAAEAAKQPTSGFKKLLPVADCYRAMAVFRLEKKDEAKALLAEVAAAMRPVPKDDLLTSGMTRDVQQIFVWLSFKEAKMLIGFDEEKKSGIVPPPREKK